MSKPLKLVFENPETRHLRRHALEAAKRGHEMLKQGELSHLPGAVVVGCGNSLMDPEVEGKVRQAAQDGWLIVGLKEAIAHLRNKGVKVDAGCNMDPQAREADRTPCFPDVIYWVATTCHPALFDKLEQHGCTIRLFNNCCGLKDHFMAPGFVLDLTDQQKAIVAAETVLSTDDGHQFSPVMVGEIDETQFYNRVFGTGDTMQGGFTVANRAHTLLEYMGVPKIAMAGVDFGWREGSEYYAKFVAAKPLDDVFMQDSGKIDGRIWWTRGDLAASAKEVAKLILLGRVEVWGDSMALAMSRKGQDWIEESVKVA